MVHIGIIALVLERESVFREEGLPEVLRDSVLHVFAGDNAHVFRTQQLE